mgnify:CR=1 FL=1
MNWCIDSFPWINTFVIRSRVLTFDEELRILLYRGLLWKRL